MTVCNLRGLIDDTLNALAVKIIGSVPEHDATEDERLDALCSAIRCVGEAGDELEMAVRLHLRTKTATSPN